MVVDVDKTNKTICNLLENLAKDIIDQDLGNNYLIPKKLKVEKYLEYDKKQAGVIKGRIKLPLVVTNLEKDENFERLSVSRLIFTSKIGVISNTLSIHPDGYLDTKNIEPWDIIYPKIIKALLLNCVDINYVGISLDTVIDKNKRYYIEGIIFSFESINGIYNRTISNIKNNYRELFNLVKDLLSTGDLGTIDFPEFKIEKKSLICNLYLYNKETKEYDLVEPIGDIEEKLMFVYIYCSYLNINFLKMEVTHGDESKIEVIRDTVKLTYNLGNSGTCFNDFDEVSHLHPLVSTIEDDIESREYSTVLSKLKSTNLIKTSKKISSYSPVKSTCYYSDENIFISKKKTYTLSSNDLACIVSVTKDDIFKNNVISHHMLIEVGEDGIESLSTFITAFIREAYQSYMYLLSKDKIKEDFMVTLYIYIKNGKFVAYALEEDNKDNITKKYD